MTEVKELKDVQDLSASLSVKRVTVIFIALALALLGSALDMTSVATAMPKIGEELHAVSEIAWVGTSFLIAYTAFLLVNGRLSDIFGRKMCLLFSLFLIGVGDLLCGFAKSSIALFCFRAISGIGVGGVNTLVMVIVSDITTLKERGKYQGYLETMIALANGLGPLIGGAFSQKASWRWSFWFITPLVTLTAGVITLLLPQTKVEGTWRTKVKQIDYYGCFTSIGAVLLLLIPISGGGSTYSWDSPLVISMLTIGGILAICFIIVEFKVSTIPVMPAQLFERRGAKILFMHNFLAGIIYHSNSYFIPLYFQNVRGYSPIMSGVMVLPFTLSLSIASSSTGYLISKIGITNPVIRTGYLFWTCGAGGRIAWNRNTPLSVLIVCQIIEALGIGCVFQPGMIALLANTRKEDRAVTAGLRNFLRTVGGAVGLAICNAIVNNGLFAHLPTGVTREQALMIFSSSKAVVTQAGVSPVQRDAILDAYMKGMANVMKLGAPMIGVCLLTSFLIEEVKLEGAKRVSEKKKRDVEKGGRNSEPEVVVVADPSVVEEMVCFSNQDPAQQK